MDFWDKSVICYFNLKIINRKYYYVCLPADKQVSDKPSTMITKNLTVKIILFVAILSLITRLAFINTNIFFFDGDEAILGLMGIDILNGKLPVYFYGQNYGLSILEAGLISIGIIFFKTSMLAIKIPMLILWTTSVIFIALSFNKILKEKNLTILLVIAVLIFSPTWLVWSMKARGGYLTSFFFTSLTLFLLVKNSGKIKPWLWLITGAFLVIIYEAQPLWLPGILPVILYFFFTSKYTITDYLKSAGMTVLGAAAPYLFFHEAKTTAYVAWNTPQPNVMARLFDINIIKKLPDLLVESLGGNYFLSTVYEPGNYFYSKLFLLLFTACAGFLIYRLYQTKKIELSFIFLLSSLFSLSGFAVKSEPRYLLPFLGFALFMMVAIFSENENEKIKKIFIISFSALILTGVFCMSNLRNFSFVNMSLTKVDKVIVNDTKVMEKLIQLLKRENVKYVYTTNEFLQYQLNYMTRNELIAVGRKDRCRTPENIPLIMDAYEKHSEQFAIIGYNFNYQFTGKMPLIDKKIFYIIRPDKATLQQVGFFSEVKPVQ